MTAVLTFQVENKCPIILGDLLLSGLQVSDRKVFVPTDVNIRDIFPSGSKFVPVALQQKIVVISDNLVIGWSGNYLNAKDVIRDLYAENESSQLTLHSLNSFFRSIPQHYWEAGLGFVGFIKDQNGIGRFGFHYESLKTEKFGKVGFLGTGSNDLEELVSKFSGELIKPLSGQPNILEISISYALAITGVLLNVELSTFSTLKKFYGGGYEIAALINGKFQKLDGVVYSFWTANVSKNSVQISRTPLHSMSIGYEDDILLIRSTSFNKNEPLSIDESGYAILPMNMKKIVPDNEIRSLKLPDLNQKWHCNYFLVKKDSGETEIYCRIDYRPRIDRGVLFHNEQNKTIVSVQKEFIESVAEQIYRKFL